MNDIDKMIDEEVDAAEAKLTESPIEKKEKDQLSEAREPIRYIVQEMINKIDNGPIHLEEKVSHPFTKARLDTVYVEHKNQDYVQENIIIPFHILDQLHEEVTTTIEGCTFIPESKINVCFEELDRANTVEESHFGIVESYKLTNFEPNSGSVSATLIGKVKWNDPNAIDLSEDK